MKNSTIFRGALGAVVLLSGLLAAGITASAQDNARKYLPTKAEIQRVGFAGWLPPWEFRSFKTARFQYEAFPSEEAYFASTELAKTFANKKAMLDQMRNLPSEQFAEMQLAMTAQLAALDKEGIRPVPPFPTLQQRIQQELIENARQGKITKELMLELYDKHLGPITSAAEIVFAKVAPPQPDDPEETTRSAKVHIRIYLYEPSAVQKNGLLTPYSQQDAASLENKLLRYYNDVARLLLKSRGAELERELEEQLAISSENRTPTTNERIRDLSAALAALDKLQKCPPRIEAASPAIGAECLVLRANYTFPEAARADLQKAGGDVSSQVNAFVRQGRARAEVELLTNDNSLIAAEMFDKLLRLLASKLQLM